MVNDDPAYRIERLIAHIAAYLCANPHAADTISGIHKWWLSSVGDGVDNRDVDRAIQVMQTSGMLECRALPDGTQIYGRPSSRQMRK